ncbi:MAG: Cna B-type domain-containing protein [Oscillospiraceae bacterium]|nr:Cna B-type domain-containing protein [Oscillospiraceae bacterium]
MKKRFFALLVALAMLLTLFPAAALAEDSAADQAEEEAVAAEAVETAEEAEVAAQAEDIAEAAADGDQEPEPEEVTESEAPAEEPSDPPAEESVQEPEAQEPEADEAEEQPDAAQEPAEQSEEPAEVQTPAAQTVTFTQKLKEGLKVVAVAAPEAGLEGADMKVELLGEDADARDALDESGVEYEGFLAMDISFVRDGVEIEPASGTVQVSFELDADLLPDEADLSTLEVQHHEEKADGSVEVETVADFAGPANGSVEVVGSSSAAIVAAEFKVARFSTFTITWSGMMATYFEVTVHFVNTNGDEIDAPARDITVSNGQTITFASYAPEVSGLSYKEARYNSASGNVITNVVASQRTAMGNTTRYLTFNNGSSQVAQLSRSNFQETRTADVYLVYETDSVTPSTPELERSLTHTKTVEDNGDGTFQLDLTISGAVGSSSQKVKLDVLLIVDRSGSMSGRLMNGLKEAINGTSAKDGLIDTIEDNDAIDARYAVVSFSSQDYISNADGPARASKTECGWTDDAATVETAVRNIPANGGTNYQSGIRLGKNLLTSARADAQKVVIFLTDGEPTFRLTSTNNRIDEAGNGTSDNGGYNQAAAVGEIQGMSCNFFYAVGYGSAGVLETNMTQLVNNVGTASGASRPSTRKFIDADTPETLFAEFQQIAADVTQILCDNVAVVDSLSENVEVSTQTIEGNVAPTAMTVKITKADDSELSGEGSVTLPATDNNAAATITAVFEDGQIKLQFPSDYKLEANWEYSVIATIVPTETAYENFREAGSTYPDRADANTGEYSGQMGLYANQQATVTYRYNGETVTEYFPKPVIRLTPATLRIEKTVEGLAEDQKSYDTLLETLSFDVTINGESQSIPMSSFEIDDATGIFFYNLGGLSPDSEFSVTESGAELAYYELDAKSTDTTGTLAANESATASFTNSYAVETTQVTASKVWEDNDNQDGKRPDSITIQLLANGTANGQTATLNEANNWTHTFQDLPVLSAGALITYTVEETNVPEGYEASYSTDGLTVTNTHEIEKTSASGQKVWVDADDQDGIRPTTITVHLLADGQKVKSTTVSAEDNWAWTFGDLDKYANGEEIEYTFSEETVEGYSASYNGTTIVNTHIPATTSVSGAKTWDDADDQDGKRPDSITIRLKADGEEVDSKTVTEADNWAWTFEDLAVYAAGEEIVYTITEDTVEGYTTSVSGFDVTNTHEIELTDITVTKTWDDADDQDGKRPDSITVHLLADGVEVDSKTIAETDGWAWTFEELPVYAAGKEIVYTITEDTVEGYTTSISGFDVTNTHEIEKTSISGAKTWDDDGDRDGKRPDSITVHLLANGLEVDSRTVTETDGWAWTFEDLDVYSGGSPISYTVTEDKVDDYSTEIDGYNVINSYTPGKTSVTVVKNWDDADDQDGVRPDSVTILLLANGKETGETLTLNADNNWTGTFSDLFTHEAGSQITYTIDEISVEGYSTIISESESGFVVSNTHEVELTKVEGHKIWNDNDDQDGKRPDSITIRLKADGEEVDSRTVTEADGWAWSFDELPVNKAGEAITYTIIEDAVEGYTTSVRGYNVINTHEIEKTSISGAKTWDDADDQDGKRPDSITIRLKADGEEVDFRTVTEADNWAWTFEDLDVYAAGEEIVYTITEDTVEGYTTSVSGFDVTNTHEVELTEITVTKTWDDADNQDGKRPDSITVRLLADGEEVATKNITEADGWAWTFEELPVYANGSEITYTVTEDAVEEYSTEISDYDITNTHTPGKTSVQVTKVWDDADNQDGYRTASVTVNLLANGQPTGMTVTLDESNNWTDTFTDLDEYKAGQPVDYTVTEDAVAEYTTEIIGSMANGYIVTNTHEIEKTQVSVSKVWSDADDQDGKRPQSVTINLLANGQPTGDTLTLTDSNGWTDTFFDLDQKADGENIIYTVTEDTVSEYTVAITGSAADGYTVTNTHEVELTTIEGAKTWEDADDQDGKRPDSITIRLKADGEEVDSRTVTEADGWAWSFEEVPVYANGEKIVYTVTEDAVTDYTTETDGFDVTNVHNPEKTTVSVTKVWDDANDQDGLRTNDVTINLLADGRSTGKSLILSEGNNWTDSFTDLDVYSGGKEIIYTVTEDEVADYTVAITGTAAEGYTITNTHAPELITLEGAKTWEDEDNRDGKRPETITVRLYADGVEVDSRTVGEADDWSWSFEDLAKYKNQGVEIIYTLAEDTVEEYSSEVNGFDVTNTHTPGKTSITVIKSWQDADDQDGIRPDAVTINLLANGQSTGETLILNADNSWTGTFSELYVFEGGQEIDYTVEEVTVDGYTTVISESESGFIVSNVHEPEVTTVAGSKIWDDNDDQDGKRPDSITINLLADGQVIDTIAVTEADNWSWSFENLPVNKAGQEIVYTISENAVEDYTTYVEGFDVINSYTPAQTSISVTKSWKDSNNADGIRPESVTIVLLADGAETDMTLTLSAKNKWSGSFDGLEIYQNGQKVEYTVAEVAVDGYNSVISGSAEKGFVVTNSHNSAPKTGDESSLMLYACLMAVSAGAVVVLLTGKKRYSK